MLFLESDMLAVTISSPLLQYPLPSPRNMSWRSSVSLEKWCCLVHLLKKVRPTLLIRLVARNLAGLLKPQLHLPSLTYRGNSLELSQFTRSKSSEQVSVETLF